MLQNVRATAFTVFELLRENQHEGWVKLAPTHVRVNLLSLQKHFSFEQYLNHLIMFLRYSH